MATIPMQMARRRTGRLRRIAVSLFAVATLMAVGAPAGATPPNGNNASCGGTLMQGGFQPPGDAQSQIKFERFGSTIVRHMAKERGSFDECVDALFEILETLP